MERSGPTSGRPRTDRPEIGLCGRPRAAKRAGLGRSSVHRVVMLMSWTAATLLLSLTIGCPPSLQPPKKVEMESIGTVKNVPTTPRDEGGDSGVTSPNSGTPSPGSGGGGSGTASGPCNSNLFDNLADALRSCEVPMPRAAEVPSIKDKLDVKISTSTGATSPGGRVEVEITLRNKSNEPIALYFTGDPAPRFDLEAVDSKGKRVDLPAGRWPGYPKGYKPEARDAKAAKVTLDKNGVAKIKVNWDAVKTKWAPERARNWEGRGYPRVPSGPLGPGKYLLRAVLPLIGDVDAPKVPIEVDPLRVLRGHRSNRRAGVVSRSLLGRVLPVTAAGVLPVAAAKLLRHLADLLGLVLGDGTVGGRLRDLGVDLRDARVELRAEPLRLLRREGRCALLHVLARLRLTRGHLLLEGSGGHREALAVIAALLTGQRRRGSKDGREREDGSHDHGSHLNETPSRFLGGARSFGLGGIDGRSDASIRGFTLLYGRSAGSA